MTTAAGPLVNGQFPANPGQETVGFFQALQNFGKTKPTDCLKLFNYAVDFPKNAGVIPASYAPTVDKVRTLTGNAKNILSGPVDLVPKVVDLANDAIILRDGAQPKNMNIYGESGARVVNVVFSAIGLVSPLHDTVELISKVVVEVPYFFAVAGCNGIALILSMGKKFFESLCIISQNDIANAATAEAQTESSRKITKALIDLVMAISYLALGIIIVLVNFCAVAVGPWYFLGFATAALIASVTGFFFDEMGKKVAPERDPNAANLLIRRPLVA